ncbi:hypothetical protein T492DRAFT_52922 [Pavlovales sp. CCMP2436]|nr:hypothetical protein T492DRAFT_52922 [Pavlovales sp. CCMP2436]
MSCSGGRPPGRRRVRPRRSWPVSPHPPRRSPGRAPCRRRAQTRRWSCSSRAAWPRAARSPLRRLSRRPTRFVVSSAGTVTLIGAPPPPYGTEQDEGEDAAVATAQHGEMSVDGSEADTDAVLAQESMGALQPPSVEPRVAWQPPPRIESAGMSMRQSVAPTTAEALAQAERVARASDVKSEYLAGVGESHPPRQVLSDPRAATAASSSLDPRRRSQPAAAVDPDSQSHDLPLSPGGSSLPAPPPPPPLLLPSLAPVGLSLSVLSTAAAAADVFEKTLTGPMTSLPVAPPRPAGMKETVAPPLAQRGGAASPRAAPAVEGPVQLGDGRVSYSYMLQTPTVGFIIGPGGRKVNEMEGATGAQVVIVQRKDVLQGGPWQSCTISGPVDCVARAEQLIRAKLAELDRLKRGDWLRDTEKLRAAGRVREADQVSGPALNEMILEFEWLRREGFGRTSVRDSLPSHRANGSAPPPPPFAAKGPAGEGVVAALARRMGFAVSDAYAPGGGGGSSGGSQRAGGTQGQGRGREQQQQPRQRGRYVLELAP